MMQKDLQFFCVTVKKSVWMRTNYPKFFSVSCLCSVLLLLSSILLSWIFFRKKNHITASLGFMFFKDMSPRICTVYLDIFCMYVNKCCFDAMFFLTRKFQSLRVFSLFFSPGEGSRRCHDGWSCDGWWWFEFLFNCWSKQLQTGPSSLVDWYK